MSIVMTASMNGTENIVRLVGRKLRKDMKMDRFNQRSSNCELYARIEALPLTAAERETALSALHDGAIIADRIVSVINGIKHLFGGTTLKPSLKH